MRRGFGDVGWWFDTSALTPPETAERIVAEAVRYPLLPLRRRKALELYGCPGSVDVGGG